MHKLRGFLVFIVLVACINSNVFSKPFSLLKINECKTVSDYSETTTVYNMDYVTFGSYPQSKATSKDPIKWVVLEKQNDKALLYSLFILDCMSFNNENEHITWEESSLRSWLNTTFYNTAFNDGEKQLIVTSNLETSEYIKDEDNDFNENFYGRPFGRIEYTTDRVFCLSVDEYNKYFWYHSDDKRNNSMTVGTTYAKENGLSGKAVNAWAPGYWLRTLYQAESLESKYRFKAVTGGNTYFASPVDSDAPGVRPAIWVSLSAINEQNIEVDESRAVERQTIEQQTVEHKVVENQIVDHQAEEKKPKEQLGNIINTPLGYYYSVNYHNVTIRTEPNDAAQVLLEMQKGDDVKVNEITNDWAYVTYRSPYSGVISGYVRCEYLLLGDENKKDGDIVINTPKIKYIERVIDVDDYSQDPDYNYQDTVVGEFEIVDVRILHDRKHWCLGIILNDAGAERLKEVTSKNKGKYLNILYNIGAPFGQRRDCEYYKIDMPITDGVIPIYDWFMREKNEYTLRAFADEMTYRYEDAFRHKNFKFLITIGDISWPKKKKLKMYRYEFKDLCDNIKDLKVVTEKDGGWGLPISTFYHVDITYSIKPLSLEQHADDIYKFNMEDSLLNHIWRIEKLPKDNKYRLYIYDEEKANMVAEQIRNKTFLLRLY